LAQLLNRTETMGDSDDVERPVLVRDVIRRDGSHAIGFRVFCPRRNESLDLDVCRSCPSSIEITGDAAGDSRVRCHPPAHDDRPRIEGGTQAVGVLLRAPIVVVRENLRIQDLASLLVERAAPQLFVVDEESRLIGAVRESDLVRTAPAALDAWPGPLVEALSGQRPTIAGDIMASTVAVRESTPVRRALLQMAVAHVRQAPIVTADGTLLGVLGDLDGLRWLAARARSAR
jgi:CBS domain-containing protein